MPIDRWNPRVWLRDWLCRPTKAERDARASSAGGANASLALDADGRISGFKILAADHRIASVSPADRTGLETRESPADHVFRAAASERDPLEAKLDALQLSIDSLQKHLQAGAEVMRLTRR